MNSEVKKYSRVSCYDFEMVGNNIFLCASDKNVICMIDIEEKCGRVIGHFPKKDLLSKNLSWSVERVDNSIVFSPFSANHICVYDLEKGTFSFHEIPLALKAGKIKYFDDQKFISIFQYRNQCFLLGRTYPGIIIMNMQNGHINVFDEFLKEIDENLAAHNNAYFSEGYAKIGNTVYFGFTCCNSLIKINLDTFEYSLIPIECDFEGIGGVCLIGDTIWITDFSKKGNAILKFNINNGSTCKVEMPIADRLLAPLRQNNILYFFPFSNTKKIICYDTIAEEWDLLNEINSILDERMGRVCASRIVCDSVIGVFDNSRKWFKMHNGKITLFDLYIDSEGFLPGLRDTKGEYIKEEKDIDLSVFLKMMAYSEK